MAWGGFLPRCGRNRGVKSIHPLIGALLGLAGAPLLGGACVPTGNAPPYDAGATATASAATIRPSLNPMTAPFEDNFDRPDAGEGTWAGLEGGAPKGAGADGGRRRDRDPETRAMPARRAQPCPCSSRMPAVRASGRSSALRRTSARTGPRSRRRAWKVEGGKLCVQNAHNHGVWLNRTLPVNVRIEFDATPFTEEGDVKAEIFGDGTSYATGTSYRMRRATSRSSAAGRTRCRSSRGSTSTAPIAKKSRSTRIPTTSGSALCKRGRPTPSRSSERRQDHPLVGRRRRLLQLERPEPPRRAESRPLRFQRVGGEGVLRQREGHASVGLPLLCRSPRGLLIGSEPTRREPERARDRDQGARGAGRIAFGTSTSSTSSASSASSRRCRARTSIAGSRCCARSRSATRRCGSSST